MVAGNTNCPKDMISGSTDCSKKMRSCTSQYKTELVENKKAIEKIFYHPNDLINVNDYLYKGDKDKGDKVCNEEIFKQECQANEACYNNLIQKIEVVQANDLVRMIGEGIKSPATQDSIKDKISSSFEHNKQLVEDIKSNRQGFH